MEPMKCLRVLQNVVQTLLGVGRFGAYDVIASTLIVIQFLDTVCCWCLSRRRSVRVFNRNIGRYLVVAAWGLGRILPSLMLYRYYSILEASKSYVDSMPEYIAEGIVCAQGA